MNEIDKLDCCLCKTTKMTYPMQRTINVDSSMVETPFGLASYSSHINIYYCKPLIQYIINFFEQRVMRECNVNKNKSDENISSVKTGNYMR